MSVTLPFPKSRPQALPEARSLVLLVVLAAVLLAACGGSDPSPDGAHPDVGTTPEAPREAGAEEALDMPPAGQVRLRIDDGGLTVLANAAPRRPLLEVLSEKLDFVLVPGDVGSEPVSVRIEGGHLRDALASVLADRAYRVEYRVAKSGGHEVSRLEIAPSGASAFVAAPDYVVPAFVPDLGGPVAAEAPETDEGETPPPGQVDWKALVMRLDDADAEERIEALKLIDPDGEGVALIIDRLGRDPDARVRATAAERLEFADTLAGVDALVRALGDGDKRVVLAAIEALELTEDYSVTEDLANLLEHPDEEIREAVADAIDFIGKPDEADDEEE